MRDRAHPWYEGSDPEVGMRFVATGLVMTLCAVGCAKDDPFAEDG